MNKEIDKEKVFEFLDKLRESGATNMFGASPYIEKAFNIGDKEARSLLVEWMETFSQRHTKTYKGWEESKQNLSDYLQEGDDVDLEMYEYFLEIMPPRTIEKDLLQIGEPYSHKEDANGKWRGTYMTLQKINGTWKYTGCRFAGERI
jgi:hypothetical protein